MQQFKTRIVDAVSSNRLRGAFVLFVARSFNSLISLIFALLAGKILTVEDHGQFAQALARIVLIQAIAEAGLQFSLVRFLSPLQRNGDLDEISGIVRASLQLKMYAALIALVTISLFVLGVLGAPVLGRIGFPNFLLPPSHPDLVPRLWLILLGGLGMSILSYLESILVSRESFIRLSLWLPSVGLIRISLLGFFLVAENASVRSEHVVFAFALGPYLAAAAFFFLFPASFFFRPSKPKIWKPWVRKLISYNFWILFAAFMSILSDWMEIHMIQDAGERGLYSAARMPMQGFLILLATMQAVLLPRFSQLKNRAEYRVIFKKIYFYIILLVLLMLPGMFLIGRLIPWWYGSNYESAVQIFWILYPNFLLRLIFAPLGTALYSLDQPRLIAVEASLRMVAGFGANLILIPQMGNTGAALASLLAQFCGWIFLIYCYHGYFTGRGFPLQKN